MQYACNCCTDIAICIHLNMKTCCIAYYFKMVSYVLNVCACEMNIYFMYMKYMSVCNYVLIQCYRLLPTTITSHTTFLAVRLNRLRPVF